MATINGFERGNGTTDKYNYEALENKPTIPAVDDTLATTGAAADAKKTGDEIADLKSAISQSSGLTEDIKIALLACFENVAWIDDDGQEYYDALEAALYPDSDLASISAVFTQGQNIIYDTDSLNTLKQYLVVTAHYSDYSTETITSYALSGTLATGTSTITVSYGGKTTTFVVTVTEYHDYPDSYTWLYKSKDDGILSERSTLVSQTLQKGTPTETIVDNLLHLVAKGEDGAYIQYNLIPNTNTNAVLIAKARCNSLPAFVNLAAGFIVMISNGTAGARLSIDSGGFRYGQGNSFSKVDFPSGFDYTDWHIYKIELTSDGKQIGYVDDTKIFESATLSSSYATMTRIGIVKNNTISQFDVDVEWIAFLDRSA